MRHALSIPYADVVIVLSIVLLIFWLWFLSRSARNRLTQVMLTVSGYFRSRPDPAIETVLRTAFSELDQELAAILGDRVAPTPPRHLPSSAVRPERVPADSAWQAEATEVGRHTVTVRQLGNRRMNSERPPGITEMPGGRFG